MKKTDLTIGTRVAYKLDSDETGQDLYLTAGAVDSEPTKNGDGKLVVSVKWDDSWRNPNPELVLVSDLALEKDVKKQASALEKEFRSYEKLVEAKLKEAAKLIKEADKLAKKAGVEGLHQMYESTYPLENAMDAAGWNTSSWSC